MKEKDGRREAKEFLVMVAMGVPGLGLLIGGIKVLQATGGFSFPGAFLMTLGGALILLTGYYHYRTDYRGPGKPGWLTFVIVSSLAAAAGIFATGTLLRLVSH